MKTVRVTSATKSFAIGHRGENLATEVVFDVSDLIATYGDGQATLMVRRPKTTIPWRPTSDPAYPVVVTKSGNTVTWIVSNIDTEYEGDGEAEIFWYVNNALAKSIVYNIQIAPDIGINEDAPPDPYQSWIDNLMDLADVVQDYVAEAKTSAEEAAESAASIEPEQFAKKDGHYSSLTAGAAEQILSTVSVVDQEPYLFRASGGSADVGSRETDMIVGGTLVWNQLFRATTDSTTSKGVTYTNNSDGSVSVSGTATAASFANYLFQSGVKNVTDGHVYLLGGATQNVPLRVCQTVAGSTRILITKYADAIVKPTLSDDATQSWIRLNVAADLTVDETVWPQLIDLTLMFGTTVAEAIYAMETESDGMGLAWVKQYLPLRYYDYNAGKLASVTGLQSHDMVSFNQWDEETVSDGYFTPAGNWIKQAGILSSENPIWVLPNTTYYLAETSGDANIYVTEWTEPVTSGTSHPNQVIRRYETHNKTFLTSENCHAIHIQMTSAYGTTYKGDVCVNFSRSGERDGEYEPYAKYSYPLDGTVTLRGKPNIDSSGKLYYDGDTYSSDGVVIRKYGERAYQSGDEQLADAITDGTTTVYKLDTTAAESANPYQNPQVLDDWGTEMYVSTGLIPVGHYTKYPQNLREKLQNLPNLADSDGDYIIRQSGNSMALVQFASLQSLPEAPTESGTYTLKITVENGTVRLIWA